MQAETQNPFNDKTDFPGKAEQNKKWQQAEASEEKTNTTGTPEKRDYSKILNLVLWAVGVIVLLALIFLGYFLLLHKGKLVFALLPPDANVFINGEVYSGDKAKNIKLRPGKHAFKVEKSGFIPYEGDVIIYYFRKAEVNVELKEKPKIEALESKKAKFIRLSSDGKYLNYYSANDSLFYRIENPFEEENNRKTTGGTPANIKELIDVSFAPDLSLAALKINNIPEKLRGTPFYVRSAARGATLTFIYDFARYDLLHQEAHFWGTNIGSIIFSPDSKKVAYFLHGDNNERSIIVSNKDGSEKERLVTLKDFVRPKISWSEDGKYITVVKQTNNYSGNQVYLLDVVSKEFVALTDQGHSVGAAFSGDSKNIIYGVYSKSPDSNICSLLNLVNISDRSKKELGVRAFVGSVGTFPSSEIVVFGKIKDETSFWKINLDTLGKEKIYSEGLSGENVSELFLDEERNKLYFVYNNILHSLVMGTE